MQDQRRVSCKAIHSSGVAGFHPWVLFFHWRNWRLREDFSAWCCTGLGEGQCGECVAASLTLSVKPVLVSVVQGDASASSLCYRIFSVVSYSWLVVTCSSYEGSKVGNNLRHHLGDVAWWNQLFNALSIDGHLCNVKHLHKYLYGKIIIATTIIIIVVIVAIADIFTCLLCTRHYAKCFRFSSS